MKNTRIIIMSPNHPDWGVFCDMLFDSLGHDLPGYCGHNHENARAILKRFPGVDIKGSLDHFRDHGGFCDCEILFNVDPDEDVDHLEFLRFLSGCANHEGVRYLKKRNGCISTSAAIIHVLQRLGYEASPLQVRVSVHSDRPKLGDVTLGSDGDGLRSTSGEQGDWPGHLVVVVQSRYLVDATLGQVNDTQESIRLSPLAAEVSSAFLSGAEDLVLSHDNATVVYTALPGKGGFKNAPDFHESRWMPLAENILIRTLHGLVGIVFTPETTCSDDEDSKTETVEQECSR
jgi:hypothetical protein